MPITAPNDWNQNGCESRRRSSSRPYSSTMASAMTRPSRAIREEPGGHAPAVQREIRAAGGGAAGVGARRARRGGAAHGHELPPAPGGRNLWR